MGGKASQRKGAGGERELMGLLRAQGFPIERGGPLSFGGVPDLTGLPGVHIECKRVEKLNLCAALRQAAEDSQYFGDGLPAVFPDDLRNFVPHQLVKYHRGSSFS